MIVDNPEALKTWLTAVLEPLCDADPAALAKYVYALVKKDKPVAQLQESMIEQLEIFLQGETKKFVKHLFTVLEKQDYTLPARASIASSTGDVSTPPAADKAGVEPGASKVTDTEPAAAEVVASEPKPSSPSPAQVQQTVSANATTPTQINGTVSSAAPSRRESDSQNYSGRPSHRKSDSDREDKSRSRGWHRGSPSPTRRSRSRSRSWERSRRSRSRDRVRERDRSRWRNKSPPSRRYDRERRRSYSRSNSAGRRANSRSRSRSRSPRHAGPRRVQYRNRSPPGGRSQSRSRSRTPDRKKEISGPDTPTQDSNHGEPDIRLTTSSQSIRSVVTQPKRRCRDFDEKGFCMRGDLCQFDHGTDPVVLEDVGLSHVLSYGPGPGPGHNGTPPTAMSGVPVLGKAPAGVAVSGGAAGLPGLGPPMAGEMAPSAPQAQVPPPTLPMMGPPPTHLAPPFPPMNRFQQPPPPPPPVPEYNPDEPEYLPRGNWSRAPYRGGPAMRGRLIRGPAPGPLGYNAIHQRELISVPVNDQSGMMVGGLKRSRPADNNQNYPQHGEVLSLDGHGPKRHAGFDFGRLGPRQKAAQTQNCSLELKKVPRGVNNITHLNNHFAKFGKIINIQVNFEDDPEAALVTFSSHAEANAAYRSTEAVLNNRFIKVFWHNNTINEGKQENVPPMKQSVKDRLGSPPTSLPNMSVKIVNTPLAQQTDAVMEEAAAALLKNQEIIQAKNNLRLKQEEKRKEAMRLTADLRKRKQDLLEKQLEQQKQLVAKLEQPNQTKEQRAKTIEAIKMVQMSVEKIQKDISSTVSTGTGTAASAAKIAAAKVLKRSTSLTKTATPALVKKSKEETQRELLDAELDLMARQQEGGDTAELKKKVALLKMEAARAASLQARATLRASRGALRARGRAINRGIRAASNALFRGGSRGRAFAHVSVDHRPSKLLVSGYEQDDKAEVLAHFTQFGELVDHVSDDAVPSLILNYKSRKEAEVAFSKGRTFGDRLLSITWFLNQPLAATRSGRGGLVSSVHHSHPHRQVMLVGGDASEDLLGEDDVEEEEDEVRSPVDEEVDENDFDDYVVEDDDTLLAY